MTTSYHVPVMLNASLKALNLDIARRAYTRLRDTRYLDLVSRIEA